MKKHHIVAGAVILFLMVSTYYIIRPSRLRQRVRPQLLMKDGAGQALVSGTLIVREGASADMRVIIAEPAYVYVFDQVETDATLIWHDPHDAQWEAGEFAGDGTHFEGVGQHEMYVVASPTPVKDASTWHVVTPESVHQACPLCELSSFTLFVTSARVLDAGM